MKIGNHYIAKMDIASMYPSPGNSGNATPPAPLGAPQQQQPQPQGGGINNPFTQTPQQ